MSIYNTSLQILESQFPQTLFLTPPPHSRKSIQSLADELDEVKVKLESLGWGLVELEEAAHLTLQEEQQQQQQQRGQGHQQKDEDTPDKGGAPHQDITTENKNTNLPPDHKEADPPDLKPGRNAPDLKGTNPPPIERTENVKLEEDMKFIAKQLQEVDIKDTSKPGKLIEELSDTTDTSGETVNTSDTTESDSDTTENESDTTESETDSSSSEEDSSSEESQHSSAGDTDRCTKSAD